MITSSSIIRYKLSDRLSSENLFCNSFFRKARRWPVRISSLMYMRKFIFFGPMQFQSWQLIGKKPVQLQRIIWYSRKRYSKEWVSLQVRLSYFSIFSRPGSMSFQAVWLFIRYFLFYELIIIIFKRMSTDFDQISASIVEQQKRIQENQQERNKRFNQCLQSYLNHLKDETQKLDSTEEQNDARNQMISSAFQNVYERIMTSSQVALRKVKETCYEKKVFWDKLIKNNAELTDLELKKDLYMQKKDAVERYEEAIQNQKVKKIPYELLLGKLKQNQSLKEWQANNKQLQQEVVKGTRTMKQWNISEDKPTVPNFRGTTMNNDSNYFINQFATQPQSGPWNRPPLKASRYNSFDQPSILSNFQYRRP